MNSLYLFYIKFCSDSCEVQDLYKVIVSTVPLRLDSIQQVGCKEYFSLHHYDNNDVVPQQVINNNNNNN